MTLTARMIEQAKPAERPYKLADANGLYLYISPTGLKSWRKNYKRDGKQATKTFGRWPDVSLVDARRACAAFAGDAASVKVATFEEVFRAWLKVKLPTLANPKHRLQVQATVEAFALPALGKLPVGEIRRAQFVAVVQAVDARGTTETAHRLAGRMTAIMDFAVDSGLIESHAASGLSRVLSSRKTKRHMHCVPLEEAPQLLRDIDGYPELQTRLALQWMALTFVRTTELRQMQWSELKKGGRVWVIPGERMKMGLPHVVPLSQQALVVLDDLRELAREGCPLVFESFKERGHPISENTLLFALYRLGYRGRMTGHGFRALASTALNELSPFKKDVIERQLAHKESDEVRSAYNRAEYLPQRRELMQWWANWLDEQRAGGK